MTLTISPQPLSAEQARIMRDAVCCDYVFCIKEGQCAESQKWWAEHIPVVDGSIAGIELGTASGARTALTLRAILPHYTHEVRLLMRDLAAAASQHVELTLVDKESARTISSVFSDFAALLCEEGAQGEAYLADVLSFLAVENIHPWIDHDTLKMGLMFPEEKPSLPNTHRLDFRLRAWSADEVLPPTNHL